MSDIVIAGLLSLLGTIIGTFAGIMTSAKLTNYRIEQLEKKVEAHNNYAVRMPVIEEKYDGLDKRVTHLEEKVGAK